MNPSTDKPVPVRSRRGLSLRYKLLLPYLLILTFLGLAAGYGSLELVRSSFTQSADDRLSATREILFREFKKQETLLETYSVFLQHFQNLSDRFPAAEEVGILNDRLFNTLEESNISVVFYPADSDAFIPLPTLKPLFEQVMRSGQMRFRYTNEMGGVPVLMVAAPLQHKGRVHRIMVLQTGMGDDFLNKVVAPLGIEASLHNLEGRSLAKSTASVQVPALNDSQLVAVSNGEQLFMDVGGARGSQRLLYSAIPLGSSDLIFLALQTSVANTAAIQQTIMLRLGLTILGAMLLGLAIYFRIVSKITLPARSLREAAEAISRGNLNYRVIDFPDDELGQVADAFNNMSGSIENFTRDKIDKAVAQAVAQEKVRQEVIVDKYKKDVAKAHEELRSQQKETTALLQLNQAMISAVDLNVLFDRILQVMHETLDCDHIVLLNYNPGDSVLEVARVAGLDSEALRDVKFTFDQGITGQVAQTRRLAYIKDLGKEERNLSYHGQVATRGSMVSVPLVVKERLVGVLNLHKKLVDGFKASELKLIQAVANQTAIAIDNAQLIDKARDLSNVDELTGLSNRRHFQEILKREVAQARRFSSVFSIVMCDIDQFRQYNEAHGRMRGDALLRQVAQVLLKNTRGIDLVCRFGNEEFVILLPKTNKPGGLATAEKLRTCLGQENFFGYGKGREGSKLSMSFGIAEFPGDSKNIYELLNLADRALFAAKKDGGNCSVAWEGPAPAPE